MNRFDVRGGRGLGFVGREGQRAVWEQPEIGRLDTVNRGPDRTVNSLRIMPAGWEQIDNQQVIVLTQRRDRLVDEAVHGEPAILVAGRDDLQQSDNSVPVGVTDHQRALLRGGRLQGEDVRPCLFCGLLR